MLYVSLGREGADRLGGFLRLSLLLFLCLHLQYCCDFLVYLDYSIGYFYLDGLLKSPVWCGYTWKKFVWCRLPQMGAYVDTIIRYSQDEDSGSRVFEVFCKVLVSCVALLVLAVARPTFHGLSSLCCDNSELQFRLFVDMASSEGLVGMKADDTSSAWLAQRSCSA